MNLDANALMALAGGNPSAHGVTMTSIGAMPQVMVPGLNPLAATATPGVPAMSGLPHMPQAPNQFDMNEISRLIEAQFKASMPMFHAMMSNFERIFEHALTAAEYKEFQAYLAGGAKGFDTLMNSDKMIPVVQLVWEAIKENKPA